MLRLRILWTARNKNYRFCVAFNIAVLHGGKQKVCKKRNIGLELEKTETICETYSPIYIDRFKQIIRCEMEMG